MRMMIMRKGLIVTLAWHMCALGEEAGNSSVFGNWAMQFPDGSPGWLSLQKTTSGVEGEFWSVGAPRQLQELIIEGDRIRFDRKYRIGPPEFVGGPPTGNRVPCRHEGKVDGDRMKLFLHNPESGGRQTIRGKRMPPLPPRPNLSTLEFDDPIVLFNGRDLTGWRLANPEQINGWRVVEGHLVNTTPKLDFQPYSRYGNLRSDGEFEGFRLTLEFNVPEGGNSGIYLRGVYEVQVVDRDSRMQGKMGVGAVFSRIAPRVNAGKPGGEWQRYEVILVDRHITVVLNGETVIDNEPLRGATNGGLMADETVPGPIYLQGDHTAVQYRNLLLYPVRR